MLNQKNEILVCEACGSDDLDQTGHLDMMTLHASVDGYHCNECDDETEVMTLREWDIMERERLEARYRD